MISWYDCTTISCRRKLWTQTDGIRYYFEGDKGVCEAAGNEVQLFNE